MVIPDERPLGPAIVAGAVGGAVTGLVLAVSSTACCMLPALATPRLASPPGMVGLIAPLLSGFSALCAIVGAGEAVSRLRPPSRFVLFMSAVLAPVAGMASAASTAVLFSGRRGPLADPFFLVVLLGTGLTLGVGLGLGQVIAGPSRAHRPLVVDRRRVPKVPWDSRLNRVILARLVTAGLITTLAGALTREGGTIFATAGVLGVPCFLWGFVHVLVGERVERRVEDLFEAPVDED